ncbi:MAG: MvaI/BcnI family restriction endonuclease [Myxococcota bacterium]
MKQISDTKLFTQVRNISKTGTYVIPNESGYKGTGGPGLLLENLLGFEPNITSFIDAIQKGVIAIDFDARTTQGNGLRDHGTKFRIHIKNLGRLYQKSQKFS